MSDIGAIPGFTSFAAQSAAFDSGDIPTRGNRGLKALVNLSAEGGTLPTLTVTIKGKDPQSGLYYTILASAALAALAAVLLEIYPGLVAAANTVANDTLPDTIRIFCVVGGSAGQNVTGTIGVDLRP